LVLFTKYDWSYQIKKYEMERACSTRGRKICAGSWLENVKERNHLEELGVDWKIILKGILKDEDGRAWTGLIRLNVVTNVCLFRTR
jgi:hypothetical protein